MKIFKICLFIIMFIFIFTTVVSANYAATEKKLNSIGSRILRIVRLIGYWVLLILGIKDVISKGLQGDRRGVGSVITNYALMFGSLYFISWIFDIIKELF